MTSIYQRAMGQDFERLHPEIQKRFGFSSADSIAAVGRGVMEEVWRGPPWTLPFLWLGAWRRIMFPERGKDVPFKIENWAYVDSLGRETVTWLRTFEIHQPPRRFDAYMIFSEGRGRIIDYMGTHQHLAVDIDLSVSESGGLQLRSSAQRFYAGPIGFRFPLLFSGVADVCEWFDEKIGRFRIDVSVTNSTWGRLFGYCGVFDVEWIPVSADGIPADAKPKHEERRD